MEFHEIASIFPMMSSEDYRELLEDIRENGLREPIWTYQGQIIDGRNRYRACQEAGISPVYREWDGQGSLIRFVVSLNLKRRHLTSSQRAMIAQDLLPRLEEEARARQGTRTDLHPNSNIRQLIPECSEEEISDNRPRTIAAELTGTNHHYVSDAKRIVKDDPELAERVRAGEVSIPAAIAMLPKPVKEEEPFRQTTIEEQIAVTSTAPVRLPIPPDALPPITIPDGVEFNIDHDPGDDVLRWLRITSKRANFSDEAIASFARTADRWDLGMVEDVEKVCRRIREYTSNQRLRVVR